MYSCHHSTQHSTAGNWKYNCRQNVSFQFTIISGFVPSPCVSVCGRVERFFFYFTQNVSGRFWHAERNSAITVYLTCFQNYIRLIKNATHCEFPVACDEKRRTTLMCTLQIVLLFLNAKHWLRKKRVRNSLVFLNKYLTRLNRSPSVLFDAHTRTHKNRPPTTQTKCCLFEN